MAWVLSVLSVVLGAGIVAMGKWMFATNAKVSVLEKQVEDFKELIEAKFDATKEMFVATNQRLDRIERTLNGALRYGQDYR